MAPTKGRTVPVTDWTAVAQNAVGECAEIDCSGNYGTLIHISAALTTDATAHTGTQFIVQTNATASGDEGWSTLVQFIDLVNSAPEVNVFSGSEAVGQTVLSTGVTTGLLDDDGVRPIYLQNVSTKANSEIAMLVSHVAATSVTVLDPITGSYTTSDKICDTAMTKLVSVPFETSRARVIIDNTYDSDGNTLDFHIATTQVTAI